MRFLFILLLLCMVVTNLPLQDKLGTVAASPMIFLSVIIVLLISLQEKFQLHIDPLTKSFLIYCFITTLISFLFLCYEVFVNGNYYSPYGDLLFLKLFRASSYNIVFFFCVYSLSYVVGRLSYGVIYNTVSHVFFLILIVGLFQYLNIYDFGLFHNNLVEYTRLRLLSPEPSMAALTANVIGLITILNYKRNFSKFIIIILLLILNIFIASKVSIIFLVVSVVLVFFMSSDSIKNKAIIFVTLLLSFPFIWYYVVEVVFVSMQRDFDMFTSFATRMTTSIWSILSLVYFPLGEGYATYLNYYSDVLNDAINISNMLFSNHLNLNELYSIIATGKGVSVKSGILSQLVYNGIVAVVFFSYIFNMTYKCINKKFHGNDAFIYKVILTYVLLSILLSVNIELMYVYVLPMVLINNREVRFE